MGRIRGDLAGPGRRAGRQNDLLGLSDPGAARLDSPAGGSESSSGAWKPVEPMSQVLVRIATRLRRITSSGNYLPELDGLRFVAIAMVVVFHIWGYYRVYAPATSVDKLADHPILHEVLRGWQGGVQLFFVISGFILGLPFARHVLNDGPPIALKQYFMRRLTRLEPPYIVAMIALFFAAIALGKYTFSQLFPSLLASLVYLHNIVFQKYPLVTVVAWSLEIEVQFYILAPLIALIFRLPQLQRRGLMLLGIVGVPVLHGFFELPFSSIYNYIQFFLAGFLLADLYATKSSKQTDAWWGVPLGLALLCYMLCVRQAETWGGRIAHPVVLAAFCYVGLFFDRWKRILGTPWLSIIGGMCYSIYLLHFAVISLFGRAVVRLQPTPYFVPNFVVHVALQLVAVVGVGAVFFHLIEKPCMRREWYRDLPWLNSWKRAAPAPANATPVVEPIAAAPSELTPPLQSGDR